MNYEFRKEDPDKVSIVGNRIQSALVPEFSIKKYIHNLIMLIFILIYNDCLSSKIFSMIEIPLTCPDPDVALILVRTSGPDLF